LQLAGRAGGPESPSPTHPGPPEGNLAEKTISLRARLVRPFLTGLAGSDGLDLRSLPHR
jgi:hypothetical protein